MIILISGTTHTEKTLIIENAANLQLCKKYGLPYILIDKNYNVEIEF